MGRKSHEHVVVHEPLVTHQSYNPYKHTCYGDHHHHNEDVYEDFVEEDVVVDETHETPVKTSKITGEIQGSGKYVEKVEVEEVRGPARRKVSHVKKSHCDHCNIDHSPKVRRVRYQ